MRPRTHDCGYGCPIEAALDVIGGRWKGVLLYHLIDGPKRNGELRRRVRGVVPRVLAQQLRELEAAGVISRTVYPEVPPKVEYALTPFGRGLEPVLLDLRDWGETYLDHVEAALDAGDESRLSPHAGAAETQLSGVRSAGPLAKP